MAFNESTIVIVGRLGRDPEFRHLANGTAVLNGSVATTIKLGSKEITNWFSFSLWEKFAEAMASRMSKGDLVYIRGPLALEEYANKEGEKRQKLVVYPDSVILLGKGTGRSVAPDGEEDPMEFPPRERPATSGGSPFGGGRR